MSETTRLKQQSFVEIAAFSSSDCGVSEAWKKYQIRCYASMLFKIYYRKFCTTLK